jgi:hypothetical protein
MKKRAAIAAIGGMALATTALTAAPSLAAPSPTGVQITFESIEPTPDPTPSNPTLPMHFQGGTCPGDMVTGVGGGDNLRATTVSDDSTQVTVDGAATFGGAPSMTIETVCAPSSQFTDVKFSRVTDHGITQFTYNREVATCPAGFYAFGGGGGFLNSAGTWLGATLVQENGPTLDGRSWAFTGFAPSGTGQLEVDTHCAPNTGRNVVVTAATAAATAAQPNVTAYANCPAGFQEIAGGFHTVNADNSTYIPVANVTPPSASHWSIPVPSSSDLHRPSWFANVNAPAGKHVLVTVQCVD